MHGSLTLVLNPRARRPRLKPPSLTAMRDVLGPRSRIHVTQNLDELDELMRKLVLQTQGPLTLSDVRRDTVCFFGGDGSIARGLTALIRHCGEERSIPPILTVRAGTINMLCNVLGVKEPVESTLSRWQAGEFTVTRAIPLLKVEVEGQLPHYGFAFAWGIGFRVLRRYYDRGPVPGLLDGVVVFFQALLSAMHPRANERAFFKADDVRLSVDGQPPSEAKLRSLVVGTIPRLSLGMRPFVPVPVAPGGFHFTAHGLPLRRIVRHLLTLGFGVFDVRELDCGNKLVVGAGVKSLDCVLTEGFTLDGEMFDLDRPTRVRVTAGPIVRFWARET